MQITHTTTKQPAGLRVLFLSELWERFGFYTVQGLLVLFLTKELLYDDVSAQNVVGAVLAFLYITPIVGGWLADRILGFKLAVICGGGLLTFAYFILAIPTAWSFKLGLALMILGTGFFKSSISSLVGELYDKVDIRRVSGFTIFYMGINLGSLFAYAIAPYIAKYFSYHWAFMLAGFGMLFGTSIFLRGLPKLAGKGVPATNILHDNTWLNVSVKAWFGLGILLAIIIITQLLEYSNLINKSVIVIGLACAALLLIIGLREGGQAARNIIALLILLTISVVFWAFFFQIFSSIILFADRIVMRTLEFGNFSTTIEAASFGILNAFFVVALSPLFAWLWLHLQRRGVRLSFPMKFSLSIIFVSIGLLTLVLALSFKSTVGMVAMIWLVVFYLMLVIAELLLSPNGLAAVSMLVPQRITGMSMGIFFATLAIGGALSSSIANLVAIPESIHDDLFAMTAIYHNMFMQLGTMLLILGVVLLILSPLIQRLIIVKPKPSTS